MNTLLTTANLLTTLTKVTNTGAIVSHITSVVAETTAVVLGNPGPQGAKGDKGDPGNIENADLFFQVVNKFSELDTPQKKVDARVNLELQYIDCGEFN